MPSQETLTDVGTSVSEQEQAMAGPELRRRFVRLIMGLVVGGSMFQLGSCDPTVRATLLAGLEQTTGTLLNTVNSNWGEVCSEFLPRDLMPTRGN